MNVEEKLKEINLIDGVMDSILIEKNGAVSFLQNESHTPKKLIESIAREVLQLGTGINSAWSNIKDFSLSYDDGKVMVQKGDDFYIVALCKSTVDLSLLRLTLNVAAKDLNDKKARKGGLGKIFSNRI
jgi:predicted regulator of Ras-like GTPase activity (Roadblock/LC7/MglB family)